MSGNKLKPPRASAISQRDLEIGRSALRSRDARNDFKINTRLPECSDLLVGTSEDHRIAAFETHDTLARLCQTDHQGIDFILLAGRPAAGFADEHAFGLSPREVENAGCDQIVEEDDVG